MKYVTILLSLPAPLTAVSQIQQRLQESTKSGYPKLISLKPWSLLLNIQASGETVWFEMLRANHRTQTALTSHVSPSRNRTIAFSVVLFLRFRTIIAIKRYGMKCNTFLYVSFVATSPYNTPSWHFYEFAAFTAKTSNVRNTESPCSSILRHIRPRPMPR